jgi:hypothetical protein
MEDQNTSAPAANPREDHRNEELDESPMSDPEQNGDAEDDPEAD